ncbi:MAG TPA: hypothetical protein VLD19_17110, partial [Chitinophagaceae bacterium]|nr:hypothetical protein [Chitinophagaceae bacterium]
MIGTRATAIERPTAINYQPTTINYMSKDLFSQQASAYAKYRPSYPAALFDYILSFVPARQTAWD